MNENPVLGKNRYAESSLGVRRHLAALPVPRPLIPPTRIPVLAAPICQGCGAGGGGGWIRAAGGGKNREKARDVIAIVGAGPK